MFSLHNTGKSIERFIKTTTWFAKAQADRNYFDHYKFVVSFSSALVGMQADVAATVDVSAVWKVAFYRWYILSDRKFPRFVMSLLKCLFPTLRSPLLRSTIDGFGNTNFVWGDTRDKSPALPRLTATLSTEKRAITFLANAAWVDSRDMDVRGSIGGGTLAIIMSLHPRLGRTSWLGKIEPGCVQSIVKYFEA